MVLTSFLFMLLAVVGAKGNCIFRQAGSQDITLQPGQAITLSCPPGHYLVPSDAYQLVCDQNWPAVLPSCHPNNQYGSGANRHYQPTSNNEANMMSYIFLLRLLGGSCKPQFSGLKDGTLPDSAFTASSFYDANGDHDPATARLDFGGSTKGWSSDNADGVGEWIDVDLGEVVRVSGVVTQGVESDEWVSKYTVSISTDGTVYNVIQENGVDKVFIGNTDSTTHVTRIFPKPVKARHVRFTVVERGASSTWTSFRLEILQCKKGGFLFG